MVEYLSGTRIQGSSTAEGTPATTSYGTSTGGTATDIDYTVAGKFTLSQKSKITALGVRTKTTGQSVKICLATGTIATNDGVVLAQAENTNTVDGYTDVTIDYTAEAGDYWILAVQTATGITYPQFYTSSNSSSDFAYNNNDNYKTSNYALAFNTTNQEQPLIKLQGGNNTGFRYTGSVITNEKDSLTNVPLNTRYEETDTRKIYRKVDPTTPTYESDFTTDEGWEEADATNTGVDTSTERLDFDIKRSTTNGKAYYDLESALSNSAWTIRFKCVMTGSANGGGSNVIGSFGMSSSTGSGTTNQDFLGHYKASDATDASVVADGGNLGPATGSSLGRPLSGTTRYHEMKRTSPTSWTNSIYSTSDYSGTPDATHTLVISSGITGLQYFSIANYNSGSGSGVCSGYIDDLKIYDGSPSFDDWKERGTA